MPVTVCASCISKLNSFHELAISCLKANEKLCKLFNVHETNLVITLYYKYLLQVVTDCQIYTVLLDSTGDAKVKSCYLWRKS